MIIFVVIYVTLYVRQMEAREKAQALAVELETANRQLTDYAARVEDLTIANERQRMARELHDTLSQGLAGLILQLEAAQAHLGQDHPAKAREIITDAMGQARRTLSEARRAIDDLRQSPQDDLDSALRATGLPLYRSHRHPLRFFLEIGSHPAGSHQGSSDSLRGGGACQHCQTRPGWQRRSEHFRGSWKTGGQDPG